jgi:hypothetical protein
VVGFPRIFFLRAFAVMPVAKRLEGMLKRIRYLQRQKTMSEFQPWIIAAIAALAALIAYFQWRTAHQRVVLDLFDRRLQTFELVEQSCASIISSGKASMEALQHLHQAKGRARFLFGDDVNSYLKERIADCALLLAFSDEAINEHPELERQALIDKKYGALTRIADFQTVAPPIFSPYMRLDQKMPNAWLPF